MKVVANIKLHTGTIYLYAKFPLRIDVMGIMEEEEENSLGEINKKALQISQNSEGIPNFSLESPTDSVNS